MSNQNLDANGVHQNLVASTFPFVTSSTYTGGPATEHSFGSMFANSLFVKNTSTSGLLFVGFTRTGIDSASNYYSLGAGEEIAVPFVFASVFVSGSTASQAYTMACGVTQIPTAGNLTGWDDLV